ncbi:MAG: twin-arginine translocase subunit TatB [Caldilineales bacterium]|nr:twin-arginine translocase subunit TatB [Caldilineales bacterium]
MFNIGIGELLLIALLALLFLGPERLPKVMREVGELVGQLRRMVNEFNSVFSDELKPLREIQGLADDLNPMKQIGNITNPPPTAKPKPVSENTIAPPKSQTQAAPAGPVATSATTGNANATQNPMTLITQARQQRPVTAPPPSGDEAIAGNGSEPTP